MAKMRKVKRSLVTAVFLWIGRRMLRRVQKHTLRTVTEKPKALRRRWRRDSAPVGQPGLRRFRRSQAAPVKAPSRTRRRTGQGIAFAVLSAAAVAVLKVGVGKVIEAEREQQVVTPDFDVFADDDE